LIRRRFLFYFLPFHAITLLVFHDYFRYAICDAMSLSATTLFRQLSLLFRFRHFAKIFAATLMFAFFRHFSHFLRRPAAAIFATPLLARQFSAYSVISSSPSCHFFHSFFSPLFRYERY